MCICNILRNRLNFPNRKKLAHSSDIVLIRTLSFMNYLILPQSIVYRIIKAAYSSVYLEHLMPWNSSAVKY